MKRFFAFLLFICAATAYAVDPVSLQESLRSKPKSTAPGPDTRIVVTEPGPVLRYLPYTSMKYVLPTASASTKGGFKVGTGLSMSGDTLNNTGVAGVASFNTRGGAVLPAVNDYSIGQISGAATVAGTGAYSDLSGKPALGTAAPLNVPATGNAAAGEVVKGNDTRLTDSRSPLAHNQAATTITSGTLDGDRLPAMSTTKKGGVPATGTPAGNCLKDDGTWGACGGGDVDSVNGYTGVVVLDAADVGADALGSATSVQGNLDSHKAAYDIYTGAGGGRMTKTNPTYSGTMTTNNADGTHYVNIGNGTAYTGPRLAGTVFGNISTVYTCPADNVCYRIDHLRPPVTATESVLGVSRPDGSTLTVVDGVLSLLGATGLESAILAGSGTIEAGKAYEATAAFYATFVNSTSTKQTAISTRVAFGNHSGTLCAATGSKIYHENWITQQAYSSACVKVPPSTDLVARMIQGKTLVSSTRNLQAVVVVPEYTTLLSSLWDGSDTIDTGGSGVALPWTSLTDTLSITSVDTGRLKIAASAGVKPTAYVTRSGLEAKQDVSVSFDWTVSTATLGTGSNQWRLADIGSKYFFRVHTSSGVVDGVSVTYKDGTNVDVISSVQAITIAQDTPYNFELKLKGSSDTVTANGNIQLLMDGVVVLSMPDITTVDSTFTQYRLGSIYVANTSVATADMFYDNLMVGWK